MTAPASPLTGEALEAIEARAADMGLWYTRNPEDHWLTEERIVSQDVPALIAEVRRLGALVAEAFREGVAYGEGDERSIYDGEMLCAWRESDSYAALVATGTGGL